MAEIKSTLEKVMEKAARMGFASRAEINDEENYKEGMRLGARYLQKKISDIMPALRHAAADQHETAQAQIRKGLADVLLRNIILPRDKEQQTTEKAIRGLIELSGGNKDLIALCDDIKKILARYLQHKEELHRQLEASFLRQIEQAVAHQMPQGGRPPEIDPSMHPKFQEEWLKIQNELNGQYERALDQHKHIALQFTTI